MMNIFRSIFHYFCLFVICANYTSSVQHMSKSKLAYTSIPVLKVSRFSVIIFLFAILCSMRSQKMQNKDPVNRIICWWV